MLVYSAAETLRGALALGADAGIHIMTDMRTDQDLQPLAVAKVFQKIMLEKKFDFVILGKQSIDDDYNQTGQILGSLMGIPSATFSSKIEFAGDNASAEVTREVDFGLQKVRVTLPAVFTCDLRLNTPRFANVQSIIKAKKKTIETLNLKDLGINVEPRLKVEKVEMPAERKGGVIVASVDELVQKLKNEAKVI
jgi:electron transfer flavoprotein beta subunit